MGRKMKIILSFVFYTFGILVSPSLICGQRSGMGGVRVTKRGTVINSQAIPKVEINREPIMVLVLRTDLIEIMRASINVLASVAIENTSVLGQSIISSNAMRVGQTRWESRSDFQEPAEFLRNSSGSAASIGLSN